MTQTAVPEMGFPDRLRKARKRLKLNQDEAAEKCGVSEKTWVNWEAGAAVANYDLVVIGLALRLDVPVEWLRSGGTEDIDRYMHQWCNQLQFGQAEGNAYWGDTCTPTKQYSTSTRAANATADSHLTRSAATAASSERSSEPSTLAA